MSKRLILLDLNFTLAVNAHVYFKTQSVEEETYRKWLLDLIKDDYIALITARPDRHREMTLARIKAETGYIFQKTFFRSNIREKVHDFKPRILTENHPAWDKQFEEYIAIESNSQTRNNYISTGIQKLKVLKAETGSRIWTSLDDAEHQKHKE